jgi:hypothetical protein
MQCLNTFIVGINIWILKINKRCQNWCPRFNYANEALELIKQVTSEVIY